MVGQLKVLQTVDKYISSKTFPRTLLLEGPWGCGKHTLVEEISTRLNIDIEDITDSLTLETLDNISISTSPRIYLINSSNISIREQNIILKFLEEPLKNSYIILLCQAKNKLIPTVVNRCVCLTFESYTEEELRSFLSETISDDILSFAHTPGMVMKIESSPIESMISLATQIFEKLRVASYSNILTIPNKLYYKEVKEELLEFDLFVYVLLNIAYKLYTASKITYNEYIYTDQLYNTCAIPNINKQQLFEHYIVSLKRFYEGEPLDEI